MKLWIRWYWPDTGWGRWHVVAGVGIGRIPETGWMGQAVMTACGKSRPVITCEGVAPRPDENCCPECEMLDDLRQRQRHAPETADDRTLVPA